MSSLTRFSSLVGDNVAMRVLVVEDNPKMAEAVGRGLKTEGFDVDISLDGIDGLWRAREYSYDAIVLDIMLPGMNGYEICRTLRGEQRTTPILMLTAKDGEYDEAEGLDLGADDYLRKPFSFVVLVARLHAMIRRGNPSPASSVVEAGRLVVDPVRRACTHHGEPVDLTAREFTLLETLVRRPGEALTRSFLLNHVWGGDQIGDSNVVDVYISYLRKKLQTENGDSPIETVRGVGYRLKDS